MKKTYKTSEVARVIGIHPNTVRLYEELELISKPIRKDNGYRVFTDIHIDQFKLARTAFQIEVLQNGLRKKMIAIVKKSALGQFDDAIRLTKDYIFSIENEIANANESVSIVNRLLLGRITEKTSSLKRKEVSDKLGITMDTLRNWETNGLLKVKRKENGYRVYTDEDIQKLKIIRSLKCANYSLSAILRMMNELSKNKNANIHQILNSPKENEDVISVCDKLIASLNSAKENAEKMECMLIDMKNKY
ncbi:MerR family transcriptional regulator [Lysinibacillus sp. 54212]|uniref:MerR family transcriptional regulator n=1 Tax=Lysinibacillus sp. 54212 TaxID=3119829 RepID=UPI002FC5AA5A